MNPMKLAFLLTLPLSTTMVPMILDSPGYAMQQCSLHGSISQQASPCVKYSVDYAIWLWVIVDTWV
jgi:hypothetical protein